MQYTKLTDDELYGLMKYGDSTAFNAIYERHWGEVYNAVYKRLMNSNQAEEIVQDIFSELWRTRATKSIGNLKNYLRVTGKYQVYAIYRREKNNPKFEEALEGIGIRDTLQADSPQNEKDLKSMISAWITTQPPKRRQIIHLGFNKEMGTKDIALKLGISRKTVQNQLLTAKAALKEYIRKMM